MTKIIVEGLTNDIIKNTLSRVLNISKDSIIIKRMSASSGWITILGFSKKLRFDGDYIILGNRGYHIDSDYQMESLGFAMENLKESTAVESDYKIDYENMSTQEIKHWLDSHNDFREYDSEEFKKYWLEVYKYYTSKENIEEADLVPREAGEIDPERRADLVARLKKYWPRVPQSWIDSRTDDYIEQVVTSYEKREKKKQDLLTKSPEDKKKEDFKERLRQALKKGE